MKKIRKRVSTIVIDDGKILGFHAQDPHSGKKYFLLPGGKIEDGESLAETAHRETLEETGYSINLDEQSKIFRKYDFEWDGQVNTCETWYFAASLQSKEAKPVNDASYHQGVDWLPVEEIQEVFNYHADILGPIQDLLP